MKIADEFSLDTIAKMGRFVNKFAMTGAGRKVPEARRGIAGAVLLFPDLLFFP
jgi:hypothetical protein